MSTPPAVEKELQRLRHLPENRICPNCRKKDTSFGFQAVCMAYKTFVCGDCKSAHQAFSHRCKSVGMSIWTAQEVASLVEANGGGNIVAAKQWLASVSETTQPSPDSHIDVKKSFVDRAYNKKEWYSSSPISKETSASTAPQVQTQRLAQQKADTGASAGKSSNAARPTAQQQQAQQQAATVNLLDDDSFCSAPVSAPLQAPAPAAAPSCNLLDDSFFNPQVVPQNNAATNQDVSSGGSAFSFIGGSQNVAPNGCAFPFSQSASLTSSQSDVASSGSAFSFVNALQGSQPSGQVCFDPLSTGGPVAPAQQQLHSPMPASSFNQQQVPGNFQPQVAQLPGNFQQPRAQMPGNFQQQAAQMPGNFGCGQMMNGHGMMTNGYGQMMNPYMQSSVGQFGQPYQASTPAAFSHGMAAGYPGMTNAGNAPTYGGATMGAACGNGTMGQPASRPSTMDQASSFDPFDPFAPEPVTVQG
jgi:hypothetical protein